ncbi:MAG: class III extradiol ring-cleavage dioxygenase [Pseudomonadota bacterium]
MLRPIFLSHGAPTLPFEDVAARRFLKGLAAGMSRPRAILVVSAHWETRVPTVNAVERNPTIHDFAGFPDALYRLTYPAPGDPELADRIVGLLAEAGLLSATDTARGLDHGAWVPLMLAWPSADIPVVQLSVQSHLGPGHHLEVGRAIAPLAEEGVLIVASGSFTHDLSSWRGQPGLAEPEWVTQFADWFDSALSAGRTCDLLAYRRLAPHAQRNHPTEEHLLPLFVALGAAGFNGPVQRLHASNTYGVLRMDAYAFGTPTIPTNQKGQQS